MGSCNSLLIRCVVTSKMTRHSNRKGDCNRHMHSMVETASPGADRHFAFAVVKDLCRIFELAKDAFDVLTDESYQGVHIKMLQHTKVHKRV